MRCVKIEVKITQGFPWVKLNQFIESERTASHGRERKKEGYEKEK